MSQPSPAARARAALPFLAPFLALALLPCLARAGSTELAGWDVFTCPDLACAPNAPDVTGSTNLDATVEQQVPGAILTSSSNIYHPSAASFFVLRDTAPGGVSAVELFLRTDGSPLEVASVLLRFGSDVRTPAVSGGSGQWTFEWDLAADAVTSYTIEWSASAAHMSLDVVELTTTEEGSIGTRYCTSTINSSGFAATIAATGSALIADDDLHFTAEGVPQQPGIFFSGVNQAQVTFGNGWLCTTGAILRGKVVSPSAGTATYRWPTSGMLPGTRQFQYWFRDPQGGGAFFNTSDAVEITLQ